MTGFCPWLLIDCGAHMVASVGCLGAALLHLLVERHQRVEVSVHLLRFLRVHPGRQVAVTLNTHHLFYLSQGVELEAATLVERVTRFRVTEI